MDDLPPLPPKMLRSNKGQKRRIKMSDLIAQTKGPKKRGRKSKATQEAEDRELAKLEAAVAKADAKVAKFHANPQQASMVVKSLGAIDRDILESSSFKAAEELRKRPIAWQPFPGVQTEFLQADEDEVLFSGGRGSGKSMCLIVDPLRYVYNKNFRALIIRRTMPELKELIGRAKDLYFQAFPTVKWREQDKSFTFASGATVEFGYCDNTDDVERYRGQQYTWIGIDEITQFPTDEFFIKLKGSLRTTDPNLKVYLRATTNPTGKGRNWVKKYFIAGNEPGKTITTVVSTHLGDMKTTKKWFNSTIKDNPALLENNPQYVATLASLPEVLRKQWLDGSWDAIEGMAFPELDPTVHVVEPFTIPRNWLRFRACDWGYSSIACNLWFAVDYDNNLYIYREFACNGNLASERGESRYTADKFAQKILHIEATHKDHTKYGVLDVSTWSRRGDSGPSIAEEMEMQGCFWRQSDRSPGSRVAAKNLMHRLLAIDETTGKPSIFIFSTCKYLLNCLQSLPVDDNNPEDVDTDADDHGWDACMYGIMSRPHIANGWDFDLTNSRHTKPIIINSTFGY